MPGSAPADALFSTWKPDSEVSRLRRGEIGMASCDPLVREVADLCEAARVRTAGAFSPFLPDEAGDLRFDPTGLVKGWAADRAAAVLEGHRGARLLPQRGGRRRRRRPGRARTATGRWRVGIEDPRDRSRMAEVVELTAGAVATSGTAARGDHLIDPATGRPVPGDGSVSVVGPALMWADVWATALFVGPPELATRLPLEQPGYRAIRL